MKAGKSLQELAAEIERQANNKHDYVASTGAMTMVADFDAPPLGSTEHPVPAVALQLGDPDTKHYRGTFGINDIAHGQIAEQVKIPKPYYDRMRTEAPDLLATNVNRWFGKYQEPRMARTLDGRLRALLSNSYRPLDNYDFANAILPIMLERKLQVVSCEITERRLYIKAVDENIQRDIPIGHRMGDGSHVIFDTAVPAMIASNSEVGFGRLVLETGTLTRACTNLCWWSDGGMKKTHLGARFNLTESVENIDHLLSERTKQKTDEALWLQLRDVLAAGFDEGRFGERCRTLKEAAEQKIAGSVEKVIEVTAKRFGFTETEQGSILRHLIEGGSITKYGLHAAVTRTAQDLDSYDRATEFEYAGSKIIELPKTDWQELAKAA